MDLTRHDSTEDTDVEAIKARYQKLAEKLEVRVDCFVSPHTNHTMLFVRGNPRGLHEFQFATDPSLLKFNQ